MVRMRPLSNDTERYIEIRSLWEAGSIDDEWDSWRAGDIYWLFYYIEKLRTDGLRLRLEKDELFSENEGQP